MSSGNPFRASVSYNSQPTPPNPSPSTHPRRPAAPAPQTSFSSGSPAPEDGRSGFEVAGAHAPIQRTKKHVRIESNTTFIPPHPDADDGGDLRATHGEYVNRPPSSNTPNSDVFASDPATQSTGWKSETTADMWSGLHTENRAPQSAVSPAGIPANPFARTLASIEPQERGAVDDRTPTERAAPGNNRASLDVESFKNLLLTGKANPRQPGPPTQTKPLSSIPSGIQFESSSSTDTSSISRQSLFEHPMEMHTESPRTSYEMAESSGDEDMGLVSEVKKGKKKPPPAPKHRHGKLVTPRQPQVVSFDSFAASEPAPSPVTRSRDNSDINKPLPPTPVVSPQPLHISTQDVTPQRLPPVQQESSDSLAAIEAPRPQKRTPPPVPLARRQSQLRTTRTGTRARSSSSLTLDSQHSVDATPPSPVSSTKDPLTAAKSPPPPPRSRHGARLADVTNSSANSSTAELPQRSMSMRNAALPPSRRITMDQESSSGLHRSSSSASKRAVSGESTASTTMPPPPPPPRRGARSSLDQQRPNIPSSSPTESRRTSTENRRTSTENRRTSMASESSLRNEYAPVDDVDGVKMKADEYALYTPSEEVENKLEKGDSSILEDMDRFQRELEELREKYQKAA